MKKCGGEPVADILRGKKINYSILMIFELQQMTNILLVKISFYRLQCVQKM